MLGESVHTVHPIAGQGFNLTLKDISTLYSVLDRYLSLGYELNHKFIFNDFYKQRIPDNTLFSFSTMFMNDAFISKNNFITTFNYIEENGAIGSSNILENTTTLNFDEKNFISFRTRKNREIDLTEYYDLIYEYKNDCLVAGIKYNKTYYTDRDLEPTEDFMLSITLVPLTSIEQKVAN